MKKTIFATVSWLLVTLLLAACVNTTTPPSSTESSQGALQDNIYFDGTSSTGSTQQSTSSTAPGSSAPSTSVPGTSAPSTSTPSTSVPSSSAAATQPSTQPGTQPSTTPATQPSTSPAKPGDNMTYAQYHALSGGEQRAFQESFADIDAFFDWYNAAKEAHEKENPPIEIGGSGEVDLGGLTGGNG